MIDMGAVKYTDEYIEHLIKKLIKRKLKEEDFQLLKTTGTRSHAGLLKKFRFERRKKNEM